MDAVGRVPKGGGPSVIVAGPVPGLLTDFVVAGPDVYIAEWDGARIQKQPIAGGSGTTLLGLDPDQTRRLATDGTSVYWVDQLAVGKVSMSGDSATSLASTKFGSSPSDANGLAVDDKNVYWTEVVAGVIKMATPK